MKTLLRLLLFSFFFISYLLGNSNNSDTLKNTNIIPKDTISIIGVGDIMLGTNYPSDDYLPPYDGENLLKPVKKILENADITFGNLEGVILTGEGTVKECKNPKYCYAFKSPDHYVNNLKVAGFDIISLANNHCNDFGIEGKENTVNKLNDVGIYYAGLDEYPYVSFIKDSIKYGFCAFSVNVGNPQITEYDVIRKIIGKLDKISDIIIVSFHGGGEGLDFRNLNRETEMYLGEDRGNPFEFARIAIDAGADIIFGHGPHVTRAIDLYKNRFIAYSMGNFATYKRFNITGPKGVAPIIKVNVNKNGEFIGANIFSTKQIGEGGPILDKYKTALKEIINLTKEDFPESNLIIKETGEVLPKN